MNSKKKLLSLALVFVLIFQMLPVAAFADGFAKADGSPPSDEDRPRIEDDLYYAGAGRTYEADDVLWEIEEQRTETEKHFRLANGSDIAVAYAYPVHYKDSAGEYQEIDNTLQLYNVDGTLSAEPVVSGLLAEDAVVAEAEPSSAVPVEQQEETVPEPLPPAPEAVVETPTPAELESPAEDEPVVAETTEDTEAPLDVSTDEVLAADEALESTEPSADEAAVAPSTEEEPDENADTPDEEIPADPVVTPIVTPEVPAEIEIPSPSPALDEKVEEQIEIEPEEIKLAIDPRVYKNNAGLASVQLAVSGGAEQLASISYGGHTVSLTPQITAAKASAELSAKEAAKRTASIAGRVKAMDSVAEKGSFEEKIMPQHLTSSLVYDGILDGSDLEYIVGETSLKENIIVKAPADSYAYSFILDAGDLTPIEQENGSISLQDKDKKAIFVIPAGYMIDAAGESSLEVNYSLKASADGKYLLTVTADDEWMNDEARVYPVTIDPPVYLQGFYNIETGTLNQYYANYPSGQQAIEYIGGFSDYASYCRILVRVNNLPIIPDNSYVVNSGIYLYETSYSHVGMPSLRIQAQALAYNSPTEGYWCLYHTWNDCPPLDSNIIDFVDVENSSKFYTLNVTREAVKWYNNPSTNYGICLKSTLEGAMNYSSVANATFCSSNTSNADARPFFVVEYRNCAGLESYYTYQTHSIDRAGTGYIGDYSGQLTLIKNDVSSASTVNPVGINHVYNSTYSGGEYRNAVFGAYGRYSGMNLGPGWMLDAQQVVANTGYGTIVYADGDGTLHYFYPDGSVYKDEDGLGLTLTESGTNYTIKDKKDNISYFADGMLSYVQDANGNRVNYVRNGSGQITSVTRQNTGASAETIATLSYNASGYLTSITDSANNTTSYSYDGSGRLSTVTHADGTTATYTYTSSSKLASAKDNESGYSMNYEYNSNTGKVSKFYEKAGTVTGSIIQADGSFGGIQTYRYSGADRVLGNSDDIIGHSVLDYFGRTTGNYSTNADQTLIYGADCTAYSVNSGTSSTNNRALINSSTGTQSVNMLIDPSVETSSLNSGTWSFSGGGSASIATDSHRTGRKAVKITRNASDGSSLLSQTVSGLSANKWYVLSAYVNTSAVTSFGTSGKIAMKGSGAQTVTGTSVNWNSGGIGDGWERIYVAAQANSSGALTLTVEASGFGGSFYVDDLQMETSLFEANGTPGAASLIANGSIRTNTSWNAWLPNYLSFQTDSSFGSVLQIQGDSYQGIDVYQDIYLSQPATQTYILSGWAKANSIPLTGSGTRAFSLWVEMYYTNGEMEKHSASFNVDCTGWQYLSLPIVPKKPDLQVDVMRVYVTFCRNPNKALFTNISLIKEDAQSFKYNSDGELVSVAATDNNSQTYSYSGADLISQVTKGNGTISYEYDSRHNVTKATNDGLSMSASYDSKGNTSATTLSGNGVAKTISSSAEYDTNGNLVTKQLDARGKSVSYAYGNAISKQTGQPTGVTDAKNVTQNTTYNAANGRVNSTGIGNDVSLSYTYSGGKLSGMSRTTGSKTQTYSMSYDGFGNMTGVSVGSRNLASYTYGSSNGLMSEMSYGNGDKLGYSYDKLERVSKVYYNGSTSPAVSYSYSSDGSLSRVDDHAANKEHIYNYDALGRLTSMTERSGANGVQMYRTGYDGANRVTSVEYKVSPAWNGTFMDARSYGYTYAAADGSLTKLTLPGSGTYTYSYDGLKRLTDRSLSVGGQSYMTRSYGYLDGTMPSSTTLIVGSLANRKADGSSINSYTYSYDDVGNITAISGSTNATYTYDAQGQLLTETYGGKTYTYTYDGAGNILSVSDGSTTKSYTYGDSNWKDLLTAYNGQAISYDAIGNPTSWYDGTTFGWSNGRRLTSAVNSSAGLNNSYTYDADGLRLTKTVGNEQHKYVWQGSTLVSEYYGGKTLEFFYDESGAPYGFSYKSSSTAAPAMYYYVTNLQGDVTNVLDASGNTVASYTYNAWGKVLSSSGSMASINPIRYRGYYFDSDTGLYYLKSRYYDPQIARFINADDYVSSGQGILGCNMFAYCLNSPVVHADYAGNIAGILVATLTLAASNPLIAITLVTGTAVLLKLAFEAAARVVYEIGVAAEHYNNAIYAAKKANSNNSRSGMVDAGGGAASPTPPGNNKNDRDRNYRGKYTYNKNGVRVDYEYYGNGNGNVHIHTNSGKYKFDFSRHILVNDNGTPAPRSVQQLMNNPQISKAVLKGLKYISN